MRVDPIEQARTAGERLHPFPGGLRLRHNKKVSCETPTAPVPLSEQYVVPMRQQAGDAAEPAVVEGQSVLKGQPIGLPRLPGGSTVHAPTSGRVVSVVEHRISHPSGHSGTCVVIRSDGEDRWLDTNPLPDWQSADPSEIRALIRASGIVGLGGAVFPTDIKVTEASQRGIHTLILNGSECEPYISCDEMLMREQPDSIVLGARILQRAIGASRTVIAIEDQMGAVHRALRDAVERAGTTDVDIVKVTTIYPEGGEKQLIQVLTGLEVPSGGRPTDLGLLCQNVATASSVARAVVEGKPLIERIVTVTGNGVRRPRNLLARIGTPIAELIDLAGGYSEGTERLVIGGPMMGYALDSDQNPVIKAANCVLVLTRGDLRPPQPEMPCIRCGECARVCPATLLPQQLNLYIRNGLWPEVEEHGLSDCIECGCCDFVCPSHIPLVEWFRFGKSELRSRGRERQQAEQARARFEAREARLARLKAERRQRREQKKKALAEGPDKRQRIADAVERVRSRREGGS
jgi:electron transport complex protein RnfC